MARTSRARRISQPDADSASEESADPTAAMANVWTLSSRAAKQVAAEVKGESTEPPPPALRALFRGKRR
jgi:hypothetical protein